MQGLGTRQQIIAAISSTQPVGPQNSGFHKTTALPLTILTMQWAHSIAEKLASKLLASPILKGTAGHSVTPHCIQRRSEKKS